VSLQRGTTYKSSLLGQPGPVLLGLASIARNGGFRSDALRTYGGPSAEKLLLYPDDLYVSLKDVTQSADLLGSIARVPDGVEVGRLTQDTVKLDFKSDIPTGYLYWLLRTPQYREYCRSHAIGTTNLSLSRKDFLAFPVPRPTKDRLALADLLKALDDKIVVNDHIATKSQDLAIALGHRLISTYGTEETLLKKHSEIIRGVSYRSADLVEGGGSLVTLKCVGRNGTFQADGLKPFIGECKPSQVLLDGDIIVAQTDLTQRAEVIGRPVRVPNSSREERWVASLDLAIVRPIGSLTREVLFALLATKDFRNHALSYCNGTTVLHMSMKALSEYQFRIPDIAQAEKTSIQMRSLFARSDQVRNENLILAELRDTLLPKLMSGEIRLRDAEKVVEDAA
jgi:type I restriction enzyme S subunit